MLQVKYSSIRVLLGSAAVAVVGAICYWVPYIIGKTYCVRRHSVLNIPAGLFEKNSDDYFVYSYYAVVTVFSNLSEFFLGDIRRTFYIACFSLFFILYICFLIWISNSRIKIGLIEELNKRPVLQAPFLIITFSVVLTVLISTAPALIVTVLLVPGFLGTQAASIAVDAEVKIYAQGCDNPNYRKWQCSRLMRGDTEVARGFLIESSREWIALYSGSVSKVLSVDGLQIESIGNDLGVNKVN